MTRLIYISLILIAITSCVSSSKYLQEGSYDAAIEKSVKVLLKNPGKKKEIATLEKAYAMANQNDQDAIDQLLLSGQPNIYEEIHSRYVRMRNRQELVERLSQNVLDTIGFTHVNYNKSLANFRKKAAEFLYAHAEMQLQKGDKYSARSAYDELVRVKTFYEVYKETDRLINEAIYLGTNNVLIQFTNDSKSIIPEDFEKDLLKISLKDLKIDWVNFETYKIAETYYDYSIILRIKEITISPDFVNNENYTESREIEDGFDYVLDENGNVMKDSVGNDIKIKRTATVSCNVKETILQKNAIVRGSLDIFNNTTKQLIKTEQIVVQDNFEYRFATAYGDLNALSKKNRKLIRKKPIPFPSSLLMIYNTNEGMKDKAKHIISRNWRLLLD